MASTLAFPEYFIEQPVPYWNIKVLWSIVDVFTCLSVWHVCFITIDRFIAVLCPYKYIKIKEMKRFVRWQGHGIDFITSLT